MDIFDTFFNKKELEGDNEPEENDIIEGELNDDEPNVWEYITNLIQNAETVTDGTLAWMIGERVRKEVLFITDAEKGTEILEALGNRLSKDMDEFYNYEYLLDSIAIAEAFPDMTIYNDLAETLSLEQLNTIANLDDDLERTYYTELCRAEKWDMRTLRQKIGRDTFAQEFKKED